MRTGPAPVARRRHLLEVPAGAGDRAAGADAGDEVRDAAVGVAPDLRPGGLVVAGRALGVRVLVGLPGAVDLAHQAVGDRVVGVRVVRRHGGRADDDLGAVRRAARRACPGRPCPGRRTRSGSPSAARRARGPTPVLPRRRLHDRAARLELAVPLGGLDHPDRDAVLHRAAGVEVLDLRQHERGQSLRHPVEADERGVAHEVDDRLRVLHVPMVAPVPVRRLGGGRRRAPGRGRGRTAGATGARRLPGYLGWRGTASAGTLALPPSVRPGNRSRSEDDGSVTLVDCGLKRAPARIVAGLRRWKAPGDVRLSDHLSRASTTLGGLVELFAFAGRGRRSTSRRLRR